MKPVVLWTDAVLFLQFIGALLYGWRVARTPHLAATWSQTFKDPAGAAAATVLAVFVALGLADSVHFRLGLASAPGEAAAYSPVTTSLLDRLLVHQLEGAETSYSQPLATHAFERRTQVTEQGAARDYPRLKHAARDLTDPPAQWRADVFARAAIGIAAGAAAAACLAALAAGWLARRSGIGIVAAARQIASGRTAYPLRTVLATAAAVCVLAGLIASLAAEYHVFGTDRVGNDLLAVVLKSVRTALVIGTMTTLVTLPIAAGLGLAAGYLGGVVDEAIQYVVTVINSIPYVLLIAAGVLILIVYLDTHPDQFQTAAERTDARLFFLCVILGMTTWTDLCRLIRGEVLKLRELDFVQAAHAFGVPAVRIMRVHLLPNVMHVILINIVINFSSLVLAEAILSYVGVGVDPSMASFGTLINTARFELGRQPVIWWTLATSFSFMFMLVLSANVFADAVRDAFDPRAARR
ncbi:MAG TPA: ABC transporter permease [Burkholderiaceae bacterium]|jgi:peptide/nickel transport system permease protein|nr:ABC transporter permease [Burkholderiaceae bacterium]